MTDERPDDAQPEADEAPGAPDPRAQYSFHPHVQGRRNTILTGCLGLAVVVLFIFAIVSGFMNLVLLGSLGAGGAGEGKQAMAQEVVREGSGKDKVLLLSVDGVITSQEQMNAFGVPTGEDMVTRLEKRLRRAAEDDEVKAVVVAIDSPGGAVTASDQIHRAIMDFKEKTEKPVVISMGGLCASGGYYISVAGDHLFAEPTTITGSIGVIMSSFNMTEALDKLGVEGVTITSGENKDLLNPAEPVKEEHVKIIRSIIDAAYDRFVQLVAEGRPDVTEEQLRTKIADGRIYTAQQALELKLIDTLGYREDAYAKARELAGLAKDAPVIKYKKPRQGLWELFGAQASQKPVISIDPNLVRNLQTPRLMYLWEGK